VAEAGGEIPDRPILHQSDFRGGSKRDRKKMWEDNRRNLTKERDGNNSRMSYTRTEPEKEVSGYKTEENLDWGGRWKISLKKKTGRKLSIISQAGETGVRKEGEENKSAG